MDASDLDRRSPLTLFCYVMSYVAHTQASFFNLPPESAWNAGLVSRGLGGAMLARDCTAHTCITVTSPSALLQARLP